MEDDTWITLTPKNKNKINNKFYNKSFDDIKNIILNTLIKYKPSYIYIYGSRARNTSKINSDVDIMIFWKYPMPSYEKLQEYKQDLVFNLKLNVDFVCMYLTNKYIKITDEKTLCYYENVILDAICIYPENNNNILQELIDYSIKFNKIKN
jgi:predicted nucleotidyltransferase